MYRADYSDSFFFQSYQER